MKKVTELTDGQVDFEFYPAEQLGKAADLLDLTSDGVTDIGFYIGSYYPSQMPIGSSLMGFQVCTRRHMKEHLPIMNSTRKILFWNQTF